MSDSLNWTSNTNTTENSCQNAQCDCVTFWEIYQQEAIKRLSNITNKNTYSYKLEPGYEARARRIAAVYAKIYLEQELNGNNNLKGRYYWMGLGAFASKTVAAVFKHGLTRYGYYFTPLSFVRDPVHAFAKGNLWLFMDIATWHYAWSVSPSSFNSCKSIRNTNNYKHIKTSLDNLPWSSCLSQIKYLQLTPEINQAFELLPSIEKVFKTTDARQVKFQNASKDLFNHLLTIAVQEQHNILQPVVWEENSVQRMAQIQRTTKTPDATLVLSSDYEVAAVKPNSKGQYVGRHAEDLAKLPEAPYSEPLDGTRVENYDSRMKWIQEAAKTYHRLMLDEFGKPFLEKELAIIAGWINSSASFHLGRDSNDGKI